MKEHPVLTRRDEGSNPSRSTKQAWQANAREMKAVSLAVECARLESRRQYSGVGDGQAVATPANVREGPRKGIGNRQEMKHEYHD